MANEWQEQLEELLREYQNARHRDQPEDVESYLEAMASDLVFVELLADEVLKHRKENS